MKVFYHLNEIYFNLSMLRKINILFQYLRESSSVILQGHKLKDKLQLLKYFLNLPIFVYKAIRENKNFRDIENDYKILSNPITIKNKYGIFYCSNNMHTVYVVVQEYEKQMQKYFNLREGVFIDIGAHIGKYSIQLANKLGKKGHVFAFEPEESNFQFLKKNIELNVINNVEAYKKGLYSTEMETTLFVSGAGEMYQSIYNRDEGWSEQTIQLTTLDHFVKENKISRIDLIKIDTERTEFEVLKGGRASLQKFRPDIIIEIGVENFDKTNQLLENIGYRKRAQIDFENFYYQFADLKR